MSEKFVRFHVYDEDEAQFKMMSAAEFVEPVHWEWLWCLLMPQVEFGPPQNIQVLLQQAEDPETGGPVAVMRVIRPEK